MTDPGVSELRGSVTDRPWGRTLAALGLRQQTGQLTIASQGKLFRIELAHGLIVGASSPLIADSVARIAVINHLVPAAQVAEITRAVDARAIDAGGDGDEIAVVARVAALSRDQARRLHELAVLQRAARTFALEVGEFVFRDQAPGQPREVQLDIRRVIWLGARTQLSDQRLTDDLRGYGARFAIKPSASGSLPRFELTAAEQPIIDALYSGTDVPELEARHRELDPRTVRALFYTLASCDVLVTMPTMRTVSAPDVTVARAPTYREPQMTRTPTPRDPMMSRIPTPRDPVVSRIPTPRDPTVSRIPTPREPTIARTPTPGVPIITRTTTTLDPIVPRVVTPPAGVRAAAPELPHTATSPSVSRTATPPAISRAATPRAHVISRETLAARQAAIARTQSGPQTAPNVGRTATEPVELIDKKALAREACFRGDNALRADQPDKAAIELKAACELDPTDVDYAAKLGWAQFCCAIDKHEAAVEARRVLERAIQKSTAPADARFLLGRVERIVGRDQIALYHFNEVLMTNPRHAEAASEVRAIEARFASVARAPRRR